MGCKLRVKYQSIHHHNDVIKLCVNKITAQDKEVRVFSTI